MNDTVKCNECGRPAPACAWVVTPGRHKLEPSSVVCAKCRRRRRVENDEARKNVGKKVRA